VPALKLLDDLGRTLVFGRPPQRIVSLVPSDTYTVIALGARDRLVGRTRYCEADGVPDIGGTKDIDVDAVIALAPDLVIGNQEENTRVALEALAAARVPVLVSLPRRVGDGIAHVARLARIVGVTEASRELVRRGAAIGSPPPATARAFVPIWMDPVMTLNADTFGSDVLAQVGIANAFADRLRLYPLAADLGKGAAHDASGRDLRYPRVTLDEVRARGADLIVLPDEPYVFSAADEAVLHQTLPEAKIVRVSGKDLFWYGAWTIDALPRLANVLSGGRTS
jgi:ABC-type Fe3+-hydroxamate transport system substrate-binding protein